MRFSRMSGCAVAMALAMPCVVLTGCSDDGTEPEVITVADLQGSWEAQSYKVTHAAVPAISVEIISMGATIEWEVTSAGNFTGSAFIPATLAGQDLNLNFQGNFTLVGQDSIVINFSPEIPPFLTQTRAEFQYYGTTIVLIDRNTTFDFGTGEVPAIFEGTMVRK